MRLRLSPVPVSPSHVAPVAPHLKKLSVCPICQVVDACMPRDSLILIVGFDLCQSSVKNLLSNEVFFSLIRATKLCFVVIESMGGSLTRTYLKENWH